ncbi:MAG: 6,7-dimethyl-8-ribityllumazine synthase [Proteobacteria bacterium]|nr:6,7-dimethyl-8-ribityllumazine synthase [Pseudomonadota bacterium]
MAQTTYKLEGLPSIPNSKVAIFLSKWHREHSQRMVDKCSAVLKEHGCAQIETHLMPGCLEIPLAVRRIAQRTPDLDAAVVFGVILKGDTYHFDMVKDLCMSGLERVMFEFDLPIINEVLPVNRIEDVIVRSSDDNRNKGLEAAAAAIEVIDWRRKHPRRVG